MKLGRLLCALSGELFFARVLRRGIRGREQQHRAPAPLPPATSCRRGRNVTACFGHRIIATTPSQTTVSTMLTVAN